MPGRIITLLHGRQRVSCLRLAVFLGDFGSSQFLAALVNLSKFAVQCAPLMPALNLADFALQQAFHRYHKGPGIFGGYGQLQLAVPGGDGETVGHIGYMAAQGSAQRLW